MLRLGADRDELSIVVGSSSACPTYAQDIAQVHSFYFVLSRFQKIHRQAIYHYCGDEPCSWYEFARAIFLEAEVQGLKTLTTLSRLSRLIIRLPRLVLHIRY